MKKDFDLQIFGQLVSLHGTTAQHEVVFSVPQPGVVDGRRRKGIDAQGDVGIDLGEAVDDRPQDGGSYRIGAADRELAGRRISQELDVPNALLQFVKRDQAAFEQGIAIDRGLDTPSAAIQKPDAEGVFKIDDGFGNGRLRNTKLLGGLGHAAALDDREERVQVSEPQTPADLSIPRNAFGHIQSLMSAKRNREFRLSHNSLRCNRNGMVANEGGRRCRGDIACLS